MDFALSIASSHTTIRNYEGCKHAYLKAEFYKAISALHRTVKSDCFVIQSTQPEPKKVELHIKSTAHFVRGLYKSKSYSSFHEETPTLNKRNLCPSKKKCQGGSYLLYHTS